MSIITRYLLRQFLGPLLLCFVSFNLIFVMFDLFARLSRFIDAGAPLSLILSYYGGIVSMYSAWFLPASCMLATLYTMWNLSHHSELTAMRASGISFHKLTLPFFCVALVMSVLSFVNAQFITPDLSAWCERVKNARFESGEPEMHVNEPYRNSVENRSWIFSEVDTTTEAGIAHSPGAVEIKVSENNVNVWGVRAERADFFDGVWWLTNPKPIQYDVDGEELSAAAAQPIELGSFVPFPEITETPLDILLSKRNWEFLSVFARCKLIRNIVDDATTNEKWFDIWYALASPWTCIVITLFAIPAGITTGRQSVFRGIALVLATFFGFYAFTLALEYCGQHGWLHPFLAAWLPNLVFLAVGARMYKRLT